MELLAMCISEDTQAAELVLQPMDMQHRGEMNIYSMKPLDRGDVCYPSKSHISAFLLHLLVLFLPDIQTRAGEGPQNPLNFKKITTEGKDKVTVWSSLINHRFFMESFFFETSFFTWLLVDSSLTRGTVLAFPCLGNRRWDGRQQITLLWELKVSISPHFKWQCPNPHCGYIGRWSL